MLAIKRIHCYINLLCTGACTATVRTTVQCKKVFVICSRTFFIENNMDIALHPFVTGNSSQCVLNAVLKFNIALCVLLYHAQKNCF